MRELFSVLPQMKPKTPSICAFGQRSLTSSFKPLTSSKDGDSQTKPSDNKKRKNPSISFTEFLDRKLDSNAMPPKTAQKQRLFTSVVGRAVEGEHIAVPDKTVFQMFKCPRQEKEQFPAEQSDEQDSRKRRNPFRVSSQGLSFKVLTSNLCMTALHIAAFDVRLPIGYCFKDCGREVNVAKCAFSGGSPILSGGENKTNTSKHLVILGDDPKPKPRTRDASFFRNKKPRMLFNHYASGGGWWDSNMEGIDNEEVGCNEVWEGLGSTTLGGLQWH